MNDSHHGASKEQAEDAQERLTADSVKLLSTNEVIGYGLGGFYSIYGLIFLFLCAFFVKHAYDELAFDQKTDPMVITISDVGNLASNDYVKLICELDHESGMDIKTIGGKEYSLIPVAGTDNRLIVFQSGVTTEKEMVIKKRTFTGRVVGKGWADEYDVEANRIKLQEQFARENITIPDDALILASGAKPEFKIWPMVLGVISALVFLHFLNSLRLTISFLSDRDKLADYVNSKIDNKTDE